MFLIFYKKLLLCWLVVDSLLKSFFPVPFTLVKWSAAGLGKVVKSPKVVPSTFFCENTHSHPKGFPIGLTQSLHTDRSIVISQMWKLLTRLTHIFATYWIGNIFTHFLQWTIFKAVKYDMNLISRGQFSAVTVSLVKSHVLDQVKLSTMHSSASFVQRKRT